MKKGILIIVLVVMKGRSVARCPGPSFVNQSYISILIQPEEMFYVNFTSMKLKLN